MLQKTILILLCLTVNLMAIAQSEKELYAIEKIVILSANYDSAEKDSYQKTYLKELNKIRKNSENDHQLNAVINALIAQELSNRNLHQKALPFLKKSLKNRRKDEALLAKRWALDALIDNAFEREDFNSILKYSKEWISLTIKNPKDLEKIYGYNLEGKQYINIELTQLYGRLSPQQSYYRNAPAKDKKQERAKMSHGLIKYLLKHFPEEEAQIMEDAKAFYTYMVENSLYISENPKMAFYWLKKADKLIGRNSFCRI